MKRNAVKRTERGNLEWIKKEEEREKGGKLPEKSSGCVLDEGGVNNGPAKGQQEGLVGTLQLN